MVEKQAHWRLENVTKTYTMGQVQVTALRETSMEIHEGELLVILGPSGSGKTTLLNLLGGMDTPTGGRLFFDGESLEGANEKRLTAYRRDVVGFVFQFFNLIPDLTALENVALGAHLARNPLSPETVLQEVGMADRMKHFPSQMSGGEQQRVSIARAVVKNPRLLLCDEPTGSLDCSTGRVILELLEKVNRTYGTTVVIVSHNAAIGGMGMRVATMSSGRIANWAIHPAPVSPKEIEW
jgi:putative ABC transport system ATP-binding protein